MKMTATTHIPRQSANNHLFRRALFCSFGVRNIIFVVIFFPFHHTTLSLDSNRASHLLPIAQALPPTFPLGRAASACIAKESPTSFRSSWSSKFQCPLPFAPRAQLSPQCWSLRDSAQALPLRLEPKSQCDAFFRVSHYARSFWQTPAAKRPSTRPKGGLALHLSAASRKACRSQTRISTCSWWLPARFRTKR